MTRKIRKRLLEKKAVLRQLLKSNTLEKQHALIERLRTINDKLDIHKNQLICGSKGGQR
ncbi:hypothetical protein [Candidatus Kuenenia stuttgartiensis]|nr:hypothetical protein [Candidatus Kuenenia stuttgartiensis]